MSIFSRMTVTYVHALISKSLPETHACRTLFRLTPHTTQNFVKLTNQNITRVTEMEVSGEKQAIPIADLGVDQLTFLQRQLDQEIGFLTESLKELKIFESKFVTSEESVSNVAKIPSDGEILIPLTESVMLDFQMYIPAKIADSTNHLIEIGTGYFVEMNTEKALDYFKRKQAFLKKQMEVIEGVLPEKYRARNAIVDNLQKKINAYCSQRIDGRKCDEFREVKVIVGSELGSCLVMLGETRVLAQVSCSLVEPSTARGNMGIVEVQVDMSPIASPDYEDGRLGSKGLELMRILELLFRNCGVIDLESLCMRSFKQVWQIRIDVHVLASDGSLVDCACIASLTALAHFRRPDVSVLPDSIIIHGSDEKIPISLNIYHMPICVTFGITASGQNIIDPTDKEEQCIKGVLIVATNKRHEICALHQSGNFLLNEQLIVHCVDRAIQRAADVSELIHSVIADDNLKRSNRHQVNGFSELITLNMLTTHQCEPNELIAPAVKVDALESVPIIEDDVTVGDNQMQIGTAGKVARRKDDEDAKLMEQVQSISSLEELKEQKNKNTRYLEEVDELLQGIEEEFGLSD
uniref:Exosome complex component RRP45 n=1 Tax=Setaria digitata TaxID=48799 RepID=A0A915Q1W1_9BILA